MNMPFRWTAMAVSAALAGCTLPSDPGAPTAAALACSLPSNCVSTIDGGAEPLHFDGDAPAALARLQRTLASFGEARIVRSDATSVDTIFTTPIGFQDEVAFRIDVPQHRIDFRSRSRIGLFDFGKNRSRMRDFASRYAAVD